MGGATAARVRGRRAGADRQRRLPPVPGRCLRRDHARPRTRAAARGRRRQLLLGAAAGPARLRREEPGPPRPRHLGDARPAALLHPFPRDDLGGLRLRRAGRRRARTRGPGRALARAARPDARRDRGARLQREARQLRAALRRHRAGCRAAAAARRSGSSPTTTRGCSRPRPASRQELLDQGLLRRYRATAPTTPDQIPGDENAFLACTFWLVQHYAMSGRVDQATALMDRMVGLANDVGLLSEEYDVRAGPDDGQLPAGVLPPRARPGRRRDLPRRRASPGARVPSSADTRPG